MPNILQKRLGDEVNVLHWETARHWAGWGDDPYYGWAGYTVQVPLTNMLWLYIYFL